MAVTLPRVSVLMPVFEGARLLPRAIASLLRQTKAEWELLIVDDGSADDTPAAAARFRADPRVRYRRLPYNRGLGAALNVGLREARAPFVAYLPADDVYGRSHLASLCRVAADPAVALAWSGVCHRGERTEGAPPGHSLQLVQVMHRRTRDRWAERAELESDDLERLFWSALRRRGEARGTGEVTCAWTDHPGQRHKAIRESHDGGLNVFRRHYRVATPLRFHSTDSGVVDEPALYRRFRERPPPEPAPGGLRILLVGELSVNPERVLAFAERGHRLFGLWTPHGLGDNTVGPLPFGQVGEIPRTGWREAVRALRPDLIYAQLNWRAVPFAREVLAAGTGVPFVWHTKESPQRSIARGEWPQLAELHQRSDAQVYSSPEQRAWFEQILPGCRNPERSMVLDGSLPKREWFEGGPARRLSRQDGEVHTAVLGRPIGFDAEFLAALAARRIHVHFHGLVRAHGPTGGWRSWLADAQRAASGYVHVHPRVDQRDWMRVLSRYDAGWMHRVRSTNGGELARATWDDLNYPARIGALMAAGLPLLQRRSPGCAVAVDALIREQGVGLLYEDAEDAAAQLRDRSRLTRVRATTWERRHDFTFDRRVDALLRLFREVVHP